ncbi:protein YqbG [Blautia sp. MSJ-19]|uniref:protein YqbG n=1 Tax=Blautia sp. MSJ-19 TaxID=2841517 RepID=UPI001C0F15B2|nr:DUF3199 family protein [Blautia sp. MSJ-19]MBU5481814.1 DUF3199 family protein [Blautia sp. MSJ-19]
MAVKRPWVLPDDVKSYTSHKEVSERPDDKLAFDIARAEMKIIHITNNKFAGYDEIPKPVKMAVILVAEAYAKNDTDAAKKNIKSESFDDYSYTVEASTISLDSLDLEELLADYIITDGIGKTVMRLRAL